jgi:hypothetical protein
MMNVYEVRCMVPARSAREAVEELGGRSAAWLDDVVSGVVLVDEGGAEPSMDASYDPADHPLVVRL